MNRLIKSLTNEPIWTTIAALILTHSDVRRRSEGVNLSSSKNWLRQASETQPLIDAIRWSRWSRRTATWKRGTKRAMLSSRWNTMHYGKRDQRISAEIIRFVGEFQAIAIRVSTQPIVEEVYASVHPPYMLQSVSLLDDPAKFQRLKERHRIRLQRVRKARETAPDDVKEFLHRQFYDQDGRAKHIASGRATLAEIRTLLQAAVDQGFVSALRGKKHPDGHDLRKWLKTYGVGIDCSGFVQQVLQRLVDVHRLEMGNVSHREADPDLPFLRCQWVYAAIRERAEETARLFMRVSTPAQARPGDILVSRQHMRIVADIDIGADDGVIFTLAEATSASDIPAGQIREETDIGPRIIQIQFAKPDQPIAEQTPLRKRLIDDMFQADEAENAYVIGRYRKLDHDCL